MRRLSLKTLRGARAAHSLRLASIPGVIGTGVGIKRAGGEEAEPAALIVFVDRKIDMSELPNEALVPKFVNYKGRRVPTDVVELNGIRREFSGPPYFIYDKATKGTVTSFARAQNMALIVTCAHCLLGPDGNPNTVNPVGVWDAASNSYVGVGETAYSITSPGLGVTGSFGFVDAGLATIEHPGLLARAHASPPLTFANSIKHGTSVIGVSPSGTLLGVVDATEVEVYGYRTDILVRVAGEGTHPGSSGMLWRSATGTAVGMHAYGGQFGPGSGSLYSLATAAKRVMAQLQVQLLDPA